MTVWETEEMTPDVEGGKKALQSILKLLAWYRSQWLWNTLQYFFFPPQCLKSSPLFPTLSCISGPSGEPGFWWEYYPGTHRHRPCSKALLVLRITVHAFLLICLVSEHLSVSDNKRVLPLWFHPLDLLILLLVGDTPWSLTEASASAFKWSLINPWWPFQSFD